jgi:hypothetical protein
MTTLTTPDYRILSNHGVAEKRQRCSNDQNALFALRSFQPGEIIADFSAGTIAAEPTYLTVQVGVGKHITLQPEFLQYINIVSILGWENSEIARTVIGTSFEWIDMLAYIAGFGIVLFSEKYLVKRDFGFGYRAGQE